MPRKCTSEEFDYIDSGDEEEGSELKIGSKNVQRWFRLKQKFGFNSDADFTEYLLTLAGSKRSGECLPNKTIQPPLDDNASASKNESPVATCAPKADDEDSSKCEPLISLLMECDEH